MENIEMNQLLDEIFNQEVPEMKNRMTTNELRKTYSQADELKGMLKGMECLGCFFEPFHDITIYRDEFGKFWYSSYYIGD